MATVTRINGTKATVATLYNPNCNLYLITVKNASNTAINLQVEDGADGDGAGADTAAADQVVEQIVKEISPLAYFVPAASSGVIYVVMDKAINDATELQTRIRYIGKDAGATTTSVGPNDVDISGTTVAAATSFTVGA